MDRAGVDERQRPPTLHVAPLQVGGLLAERLFRRRTVVLTSATLALGGSFEPLARQWGLPRPARERTGATGARAPRRAGSAATRDGAAVGRRRSHGLAWSGWDVGSPFDHPRSGILYVARHLPPPGRDGLPPSYLDRDPRADRRRGRPHARAVLVDARGAAGHRGTARRARPAPAVPGRGCHRAAGQAVRRGRGNLPVRHAVPVAGRGRARARAAAGGDRQDPVPAARRSTCLGPAAGGGRARRQRVHDRGGGARRRCCSPRARAGYCGPWRTRGWSPCSTRAWPPRATAASCAHPCRRSGPTTDPEVARAALRRLAAANTG